MGGKGIERDWESNSQDHDAQELEQAQSSPFWSQAGPECGRDPEGAGQKADARRGLQVPECAEAPIRPPRSLKGSSNHSRRVAEAFALQPRLGGRRSGLGSRLSGLQASAAPRGAPIAAFLARGFPAEAPVFPGSSPRPPAAPMPRHG